MRNYFTFDGVDSRSFGVYISGQGTFKAPARSYDAIEIPGRNGALLGIDSRLGNVELTYPAFIYSNFKENVAAFRAFLLSHKGYFKLKDSYHPDEFRLAYYPGPFEPDVTSANNAGSFDITFICKPQRYLESGQEVVELSPSTAQVKTYTGNIVEIEPGIGDRVTGLTVPFIPIQDLHGYENPWPGGGGVNKFGCADGAYAVGSTRTVEVANGVWAYKVNITATSSTFLPERTLSAMNIPKLTAGTYTFSLASNAIASAVVATATLNLSDGQAITNGNSFTVSAETSVVSITTQSTGGYEVGTYTCYIQIESGTSATSWQPYSNICPITGLTGLSAYVGPTQDPDDATVYNVHWTTEAGTVYGGTLDVVTGMLTVTMANIASYNGEAIGEPWLSSMDAYASGTTPTIGAQVVYTLATPQTYQLTPQDITLIQNALNYIWSNAGPVTVEVTEGLRVTNPTLFDALPFLRVYGTGTLGMGSHTITITAADEYTDIDCEMMDCFKGSANKNQYVQFSGNDFPTLEPGVNGFSFSGITKVEVKPRWWSV